MIAVSPSEALGVEIHDIRVPRFSLRIVEGVSGFLARGNQMQMSRHAFRIGPWRDFLKESLSLDLIDE